MRSKNETDALRGLRTVLSARVELETLKTLRVLADVSRLSVSRYLEGLVLEAWRKHLERVARSR